MPSHWENQLATSLALNLTCSASLISIFILNNHLQFTNLCFPRSRTISCLVLFNSSSIEAIHWEHSGQDIASWYDFGSSDIYHIFSFSKCILCFTNSTIAVHIWLLSKFSCVYLWAMIIRTINYMTFIYMWLISICQIMFVIWQLFILNIMSLDLCILVIMLILKYLLIESNIFDENTLSFSFLNTP